MRAAVLGSPVFGIGLTVGVYIAAIWLHRRAHRNPLLTPVLVTIVVVAASIRLLGIDYQDYLTSVQPISLLLGPATVALALPLIRSGAGLREHLVPVLLCVTVGCLIAIGSVWAVGELFDVDHQLLLSMLTRSVTSPVAIGVAEEIGAIPALAAVFTIFAGVLGAVAGPWLLTLCRINHPQARGLAMGVSAHGIGTARALQDGMVTGGWSSAGMVLNALLTTAILPVLVHLAYG